MSEEFSTEEKKLELENRRWRHRRRMAYVSLGIGSVMCLAAGYVMLFGDIERVKALGDLGAVYLGILAFLGGNVIAYVGSAAYSDVRLWK